MMPFQQLGLLSFLVLVTTILSSIAISSVNFVPEVKCSSFPARATCGNASHSIVLSADICRARHKLRKCKICIPLEKLLDVVKDYESCQFINKSLDKWFFNKRESLQGPKVTFVNYKRLQKRQAGSSNIDIKSCRTLASPKPGKVSCRILPGEITCLGTCNVGYKFEDDTYEKDLSCSDGEGFWRPYPSFPPCEPQCNPPCENGGTCIEVNKCSCTKEFRGPSCQYPLNLCAIARTDDTSSWKCNHTRSETTCNVSCHPPGSTQSLSDSYLHTCTYYGEWSPPLPPCVKSNVRWCPAPKIVSHGSMNDPEESPKSPGTRIEYTCNAGFTLHGNSVITCDKTGTWSGSKPICLANTAPDMCQEPGELLNGWKETTAKRYIIGSVISFSCYGGYVMQGDSDLVCIAGGRWSTAKPSCVKKNDETIPEVYCPYTITPLNSEVKLFAPSSTESSWSLVMKPVPKNADEGEDYTYPVGSRIRYRCRSHHYKLYGSEYQTCQSSGVWSGNKPTCIPECGKSDSPRTPFITHGNSTKIGQWPWQVAISVGTIQNQQLACGGALINEKWAITAAHCVAAYHSSQALDSRNIFVYAGKYYRSFENDDVHVQIKQVRQIVIHENYDFVRFDSDIALLEFHSSVELTVRVQPICLPTDGTSRENIKDDKLGVVIGWGKTEIGNFSKELKESVMPVVSNAECEEAYQDGPMKSFTVSDNMFCAGYKEGKVDTCIGDSGGPMMFLDESQKPNRWILEGIVSWGSGDGCGQANRYAGFTKVKMFMEWIKMIT